jgi:serine/threonine-protein kinase
MQARLGPGSRVAGYVIEEQVGAGGMAVVFRARDETLGRLAAVKVLAPALAADEQFRARFLRESRSVAAVDEPHIVPVYAAGEADGVLYIATRFVSGGDLAGLLRRVGGPLAPERAVALIAQVAAALDAAHAVGLVHRDVKPANVLIENVPGRPEHVYLSDFGLSKAATSETGLTASGVFMGTPDYSAPEQITGKPAVSARTDQYALACVAFSLLTGTVPYPREDSIATLFAHAKDPVPALTAVRPELPRAIDSVLARGMAKAPAERYASCGELAEALRAALVPAADAAAVASPPAARRGPARFTPAPSVTNPGRPAPGEPATVPVESVPVASEPGAFAWTGPAQPPRGRRTAVIAGSAAAAVLVAAGIGAALVLPGSSSTSGQTDAGVTSPASAAAAARPTVAPSSPQATAANVRVTTVALHVPNGDGLQSPVFSTDGKLVAVDNITEVVVVNAVSGKVLTTLPLPGNISVPQYAFSTNNKTLTAVDSSAPGGVYRWNLSTGQGYSPMAMPSASAGDATATLSADSSTMAVTDAARTGVDVWDVATGTRIAELADPDGAVITPVGSSFAGAISLDEDGRIATVADPRGNVYVWSVSTRRVIATLRYNYNALVNGKDRTNPAMVSPDGKLVEIKYAAKSGISTVWDVATQSNVTPGDSGWPRSHEAVWFSGGGQVIVTQRDNGAGADLWNAATGAHLAFLSYSARVPGKGTYVTAVGADGRELLTDDKNGHHYLWHVSY